ncbi:MAG: hypothetical protein AB7F28_04070 [Candidatus Margulisiibacteriota bacterium]
MQKKHLAHTSLLTAEQQTLQTLFDQKEWRILGPMVRQFIEDRATKPTTQETTTPKKQQSALKTTQDPISLTSDLVPVLARNLRALSNEDILTLASTNAEFPISTEALTGADLKAWQATCDQAFTQAINLPDITLIQVSCDAIRFPNNPEFQTLKTQLKESILAQFQKHPSEQKLLVALVYRVLTIEEAEPLLNKPTHGPLIAYLATA